MQNLKRMLMAAAAVLLLFIGWLQMTPALSGIPVLEYHMVSDSDSEEGWEYNVPPDEFRQQLDYLQGQGYTTITMLEYMKARKGKLELPEKPVILTFDDGYEDNYTTMLPILEEYGMKAMVYMITNKIGKPDYLTWDELRDMQMRGIEIGSHTANHQPLTSLDAEKQAEEMKLSKLLMEWNGIHTVFSFSYPNGAYSAEMTEMLKENEYLTAVTGDAGLNTLATDPYLMQRINIPHPRFGLAEFKFRLWKAGLMTRLGIRQHKIESRE